MITQSWSVPLAMRPSFARPTSPRFPIKIYGSGTTVQWNSTFSKHPYHKPSKFYSIDKSQSKSMVLGACGPLKKPTKFNLVYASSAKSLAPRIPSPPKVTSRIRFSKKKHASVGRVSLEETSQTQLCSRLPRQIHCSMDQASPKGRLQISILTTPPKQNPRFWVIMILAASE